MQSARIRKEVLFDLMDLLSFLYKLELDIINIFEVVAKQTFLKT